VELVAKCADSGSILAGPIAIGSQVRDPISRGIRRASKPPLRRIDSVRVCGVRARERVVLDIFLGFK